MWCAWWILKGMRPHRLAIVTAMSVQDFAFESAVTIALAAQITDPDTDLGDAKATATEA